MMKLTLRLAAMAMATLAGAHCGGEEPAPHKERYTGPQEVVDAVPPCEAFCEFATGCTSEPVLASEACRICGEYASCYGDTKAKAFWECIAGNKHCGLIADPEPGFDAQAAIYDCGGYFAPPKADDPACGTEACYNFCRHIIGCKLEELKAQDECIVACNDAILNGDTTPEYQTCVTKIDCTVLNAANAEQAVAERCGGGSSLKTGYADLNCPIAETCPVGFECVEPLEDNDGGVRDTFCAGTCSTHADCGDGYCYPNGQETLCVPPRTLVPCTNPGPAYEDKDCGGDNNQCPAGMTCVVLKGAPSTFCGVPCQDNETCGGGCCGIIDEAGSQFCVPPRLTPNGLGCPCVDE